MEARSCRAGADWVNVCRVNVIEGEPNDRQMTTGNHTVRDIYCCKCGTILGWKYVSIQFFLSASDCLSAHDELLLTFAAGQSVRTIPKVQRREVHPRAQPPRRCSIVRSPPMRANFGVSATTLLTSLV